MALEGDLTLGTQTLIVSSSAAGAPAGDVRIDADGELDATGTQIGVASPDHGGNVAVSATTHIILSDSTIRTSPATGDAGGITISTPVLILAGSEVVADENLTMGTISLTTNALLTDHDSCVAGAGACTRGRPAPHRSTAASVDHGKCGPARRLEKCRRVTMSATHRR